MLFIIVIEFIRIIRLIKLYNNKYIDFEINNFKRKNC